jgi:hypothetical protein
MANWFECKVRYDKLQENGSGVCHFQLKIFSNELLHSSFLFCIFVRIST